MRIRAAWLARLVTALHLTGCFGYQDVYTPGGIPNYHVFLPPDPANNVAGIHRTGLPPNAVAWAELKKLVEEPGRKVTKVVLHDRAEGDESPALAFGWNLIWIPLVPQGDRPLTVFEKPNNADVHRALKEILDAHARGDVVVFGCEHDRERGGLIAALLGIIMFKWTVQYAFDYMVATGSRIEVTPGLWAYWVQLTGELVP